MKQKLIAVSLRILYFAFSLPANWLISNIFKMYLLQKSKCPTISVHLPFMTERLKLHLVKGSKCLCELWGQGGMIITPSLSDFFIRGYLNQTNQTVFSDELFLDVMRSNVFFLQACSEYNMVQILLGAHNFRISLHEGVVENDFVWAGKTGRILKADIV